MLEELRAIVYEVAADWGAKHGRREVQTTSKALEALVRNLAGLTATDTRRLVRKAIDDNGAITESDLPEDETAQFSEAGGMRRLRQWLDVRKIFFVDSPRAHLDPPRGVLLLGVQGCGKSLAAKAARAFSGCRYCDWISAFSTTSITAKRNATCAKRLRRPKSCRHAFCGWTKLKRVWRAHPGHAADLNG